jgi:hypothetical protein
VSLPPALSNAALDFYLLSFKYLIFIYLTTGHCLWSSCVCKTEQRLPAAPSEPPRHAAFGPFARQTVMTPPPQFRIDTLTPLFASAWNPEPLIKTAAPLNPLFTQLLQTHCSKPFLSHLFEKHAGVGGNRRIPDPIGTIKPAPKRRTAGRFSFQ